MQVVQFVRAWALFLVLSLAGSVVGCGPSAPQASPAQQEEAAKTIAEGQRRSHQELKASIRADAAAKNAGKTRFRPPGH